MTATMPDLIGAGGSDPSTGGVRRSHVWRIVPFRRVLLTHALGQSADALLTLALAQVVVFEIGSGASPTAIVQVIAVAMIPYLIACTVATRISDRWPRRRSLGVVAATRAAVAAGATAVPLTASTTLGYSAWALSLTAAGVAMNLRSAALAHLVPGTALVAANSLSAICQRIAGIVGFGLGTFLGWWSPAASFCAASLLHAGGALAYRLCRLDLGGGSAAERRNGGRQRSRGRHLSVILAQPLARRAVAAALLHRMIAAGAFLTFILAVDSHYELEASGFALAIGLTATGTVLGTLLAPVLVARLGRRRTLALSFLPAAAASAAASLHPGPWVVVSAMIGISFIVQIIRITTDATVQGEIDDAHVGAALATYDRLYNLAYVGGALLAITGAAPGTGAGFGVVAMAYTAAAIVHTPAVFVVRAQYPSRLEPRRPS